MLFINDKVHSVDEFLEKVKKLTGKEINLADVKKSASFSRNNAIKSFDLAIFKTTGNKVPSRNQGDDILANFRWFDGNNSIEIRYAERFPYKDVQRGGVLIYTPKSVDLSDDDFGFSPNELDLAIYVLVHPSCEDSPFKKEGSVSRYAHASISKEVTRKSSKVSKLEESLKHVDRLADSELKLFAKGLSIDLNPHWGSDDIRTELKSYAMENVDKYHSSMNLHSVRFEGMVQNCIDEGYIVQEAIAGNVVWKFNYGSYKGVQITIVPTTIGDQVTYLKNYLKENIATYNDILNNVNKDAFVNLKAEAYLKSTSEKSLPSSEVDLDADVMGLEDVVDYASAVKFLTLSHPEGKSPSPAKGSSFFKAVESGEVNNINLNDEIHNYMGKIQ